MNLANQNAPATPKQLWMLHRLTGLNTKELKITLGKASNLISDAIAKVDITEELKSLGATGEVKLGGALKDKQFQEIYNKAHEAGMAAVEKLNVVPMIVEGHANPLDDNSPVTKRYFVADGQCGFAWVVIKPANSSFSKWLVKNNLARKHYPSGISIWISYFNQSIQKKETYAYAFAKVLQEAGIKAQADSRLD